MNQVDINQLRIVNNFNPQELDAYARGRFIIYKHVFQDEQTLLFKAVFAGNDHLVELILKFGDVDIDAINDLNGKKTFAIWYAAFIGRDDIVELLLDRKYNRYPTHTANLTYEGECPLNFAILSQDVRIVRELLNSGANVNIDYDNDDFEQTLIEFAIMENVDIMILKELLKAGVYVDPDKLRDYSSVIQAVIRNAKDELDAIIKIELLMEYGVNPCLKYGHDNFSDLKEAVDRGFSEITEFLLSRGKCNPNEFVGKNQLTYLIYAMAHKHKDTMKILLKYGADIDLASEKEFPILYRAVGYENPEMLKFLLENGSAPNQIHRGHTVLNSAILNKTPKHLKILLDAKANPNLANNSGTTPLINATKSTFPNVVTLLLENGANPNLPNYKDQEHFYSPLWYATRSHPFTSKETDIFIKLLEYGADENERHGPKGITHLMNAVQKGRLEAMAILLNVDNRMNKAGRVWKADPNIIIKNVSFSSALYVAIIRDSFEAVKLLLEHGADPTKGSPRTDKTLLEYANEKIDKKIYNAILPYVEEKKEEKNLEQQRYEERTKEIERELQIQKEEREKGERSDTKRSKMEVEKLMHTKFDHMKLVIKTRHGKSQILYHKGGQQFCSHIHRKQDLLNHLENEHVELPCPKCQKTD